MKTPEEIAAKVLERHRTESTRGWFDALEKEIAAAIREARIAAWEEAKRDIEYLLAKCSKLPTEISRDFADEDRMQAIRERIAKERT